MTQPDNKDNVPSYVRDVAEAIDLVNDDGTLKTFDQIMNEGFGPLVD